MELHKKDRLQRSNSIFFSRQVKVLGVLRGRVGLKLTVQDNKLSCCEKMVLGG